MLKTGGGVILNWSSVGGLNASRGTGVYSAAKAGVIAIMKAAAVEYGRGASAPMRSAPGFILTEIMGNKAGSISRRCSRRARCPTVHAPRQNRLVLASALTIVVLIWGSPGAPNYRPPRKRMPRSPKPMAQSPNRARIDAIMVSMSSCGDQAAAAARLRRAAIFFLRLLTTPPLRPFSRFASRLASLRTSPEISARRMV